MPEALTPILMNEMATIRCYANLLRIDMDLLKELADLREFRQRHPLPPKQGVVLKPKSEAIRHMEAIAMLGEFVDREISRLDRKAEAMVGGTFDQIEQADDCERETNRRIAERALDHMSAQREKRGPQ